MQNKYGWQFYHWHIEPSSKCALACPRCPRVEHPDTPWLNKELSLDIFKKTFTPDFIVEYVQRFTMCGDVGDPIYCKDYLKIVDYIKNIKPKCAIYTITNGSYKTEDWWYKFAKLSNKYDTINFSVDGYDQESNNKYRVNSDFNSIMRGMSIMGHESNAFVYWALIYFSFNQDYTTLITDMAINSGCDGIQWTKSTKFGSKYGEAYKGENDDLEPREEYISKSHRYERSVQTFTNRSPTNLEYMSINKEKYKSVKAQGNIIPLCLIGNRGMYINAEGVVHPCSWVSFPYTSLSDDNKIINYEDGFFSKYRDKMNINNEDLETILNHDLWQKLFNSWKNNTWVECNLKCQKQYVDYDYAVGYHTN